MTKYFIFFFCLLSRIIFKIGSGFSNFELFGDAKRYDLLSNDIINGNADMDIVAYLAAPLYPYTLALFKGLTSSSWEIIAVGYQFLLVSLSAVYIYKIGKLLFGNEKTAILSSIIYIIYPLTMWYNFTLSQETTFQSFLIIFCFYFLSYQYKDEKRSLIIAAGLFGLCMLTKSHILMLLPFLLGWLLISGKIKSTFLFLGIILTMSIPHGLVNLNQHGVYTLSSHGNASFFLLGHSDHTYPCLLQKTGTQGRFSSEGCVPHFIFDTEHEFPVYGLVNKLSVEERNKVRLKIGLQWIKNNPSKFLELKWYGLKRFLSPGLDRLQFKTKYWLISLLAGLFIYIPGYITLFRFARKNINRHFLMVSLILVCAAIFIIFFPVNRFRIITMEPLLMVYAAEWYRKNILGNIDLNLSRKN